jgi:hypothetical protein
LLGRLAANPAGAPLGPRARIVSTPVYDSEAAFIAEARLHATFRVRVFYTDVRTILVAAD